MDNHILRMTATVISFPFIRPKLKSGMAILPIIMSLLSACTGNHDLWQGDEVFVEARQTTNARQIEVMSDDYMEIKDRFDALERLYVDLARSSRKQDEQMKSIAQQLANVKRDPALEKAVKKLNTSLGSVRRDIKKMEGRIFSVEMAEASLKDRMDDSLPTSMQSSTKSVGTSASDAAVPIASESEEGTDQFGVHLASYRSDEQIQNGWQSIKEYYGADLADLSPVVYRQNQEGIGTFMRLIIGPFSDESAANALCNKLRQRSSDQYCTVTDYQGEKIG